MSLKFLIFLKSLKSLILLKFTISLKLLISLKSNKTLEIPHILEIPKFLELPDIFKIPDILEIPGILDNMGLERVWQGLVGFDNIDLGRVWQVLAGFGMVWFIFGNGLIGFGLCQEEFEKVWEFGVILSELLTKRELEMLTHLKSMKIHKAWHDFPWFGMVWFGD